MAGSWEHWGYYRFGCHRCTGTASASRPAGEPSPWPGGGGARCPGPVGPPGRTFVGDCRGGPPPLAESSGYDVWWLPLLPGPPHPARVVSPHGGAGRGGSFRAFKGTIQTLSRFSFRLSDWITCTRAGPGPGAMAGELSPPFDRSPRIAALKDGSGLQFDPKLRVEGPGVLGWQEEELGVLRGTGALGTCGGYI